MNYLERIQRGIDFIEANLDFDLPLRRVAEHAGLSQWHFQRIFRALTNETLKTYIRSRRFAQALDRLSTSDDRIIDVAIAAGFESQESFARAFKQAFRMTPGEYRRGGRKSALLPKVQLSRDYLRQLERNVSLTPELYEQRPMRLVGLRTRFYSVDSDKNNIGEKLPPLWAEFLERCDEVAGAVRGTCYGVLRQTPSSELLEYHAAVEASVAASPPPGMTVVELPACTYARFTHRGPARGLDHTVNFVYSTWLIQSGRRHTGGADLESYGADYHPTAADSIIRYAIPIGAPEGA